MYQDLANILDSYSDNHQLLDKGAFDAIVEAEIEHKKGLSSFIKDVKIEPYKESKTYATYNLEDKIIIIYLNYLYKMLNNLYNNLEYRRKNEIIMQVLEHEVEHAGQNLVANSHREDLESYIISASIVIQSNEDYYLRNGAKCPLERLAEIDSFLKMMQVVRCSKSNNELEYFEKVDHIMHSGYPKRFNNCPTEDYIAHANRDFYFSFSKKALEEIRAMYSLEQRLRLGLRVTKNEFKKELSPSLTLARLRK